MTVSQKSTLKVKNDIQAYALWLGERGDGPAVAVKDVIDMKGLPTRAGCRALEGAANALEDAAIIARLRQVGCHFVGKTKLHELAFGITGLNPHGSNPENPHYPAIIPGGSSSGSAAAVAAGLCDFALGTDTGGSIRVPAACCGIFGMKPSFGRISRHGMLPEYSSLDCVGPLAASLSGLVAAMAAMDETFTTLPEVHGLKINFIKAKGAKAVLEAVRCAVAIADPLFQEISLPSFAAAYEAGLVLMGKETAQAFGPLMASGQVAPDVSARLRNGAAVTDAEALAAEEVRERFTREVDSALAHIDALVLPTLPVLPPLVSEAADSLAALELTKNCRPFNLSGHPALTMPLGDIDGRPYALQVVGRKGGDESLIAVAAAIEAALTNSKKMPTFPSAKLEA